MKITGALDHIALAATAEGVSDLGGEHAPQSHASHTSWAWWVANNVTYGLECILWLLGGSRRAPPNTYLHGEYEPTHAELFESKLEVLEGSIPAELSGAFVRTGPNPYFAPKGG